MVLLMSVGVIAFLVFGRYRLPIVPPLILFAAAGIVEAAGAVARRRWRTLAVAGTAVLLTGLLAHLTLFDPQQRMAGSFYSWSNVLAQEGRTEEAIEAGREALRRDPNMPEAHYNVGNLLANRKQFVEAIAEYRAAVELRPAYPQAWNNLGIVLAMTGDRRGAAEAIIRTLEQDPATPASRENLERTLREATDPNEQDVRARIEAFLRGGRGS